MNKNINVIITKSSESYDKPFTEFYEIIKKNPQEILTPKYDYMETMFPQEYIKGLKIYINMLTGELSNLKTVISIRSKL